MFGNTTEIFLQNSQAGHPPSSSSLPSGLASVINKIGNAFYQMDGLRTGILGIMAITSSFGIVANSINMAIFSKLGTKDTVNISLLGITISDFLVCVTTIGAAICENPKVQRFMLLYLDWNPNHVTYYYFGTPHTVFERITLIITSFIMIERCVCVTFPLRVKTIFTRRRVGVGVLMCYVLAISTAIPVYSVRYHAWMFYPHLNRTIYSILKTHDYDQVNDVLTPFTVIFFYILLFIVIVICTSLLTLTLQKKSKWRQKATTSGADRPTSSRAISSKERKVAKMLAMISFLFIICNAPCTSMFLLYFIDPGFRIHGSNAHFYLLINYISFFFVSINSSLNIFIYYNNSSNYQEMFDKIFRLQRQRKKG